MCLTNEWNGAPIHATEWDTRGLTFLRYINGRDATYSTRLGCETDRRHQALHVRFPGNAGCREGYCSVAALTAMMMLFM